MQSGEGGQAYDGVSVGSIVLGVSSNGSAADGTGDSKGKGKELNGIYDGVRSPLLRRCSSLEEGLGGEADNDDNEFESEVCPPSPRYEGNYHKLS